MWPHQIRCGPQNKTLKLGEACLVVDSSASNLVTLFTLDSECYQCPFEKEGIISPNSFSEFIVDTSHALNFYLTNDKSKFCEKQEYFEDFGVYQLNVTETDCSNLVIQRSPERMWIDILVAIGIYLGVWLCFWLIESRCVNNLFLRRPFVELREDLGGTSNVSNKRLNRARTFKDSRLNTIDVFRGLAVFVMIFVNYGGGQYAIFKHAPWDGLTIADIVFPMFIWVMGVSIVLSLRSQLRAIVPRSRIFQKIVVRSFLLIILGIILNSGKISAHQSLRVPGVLQRIGVTYFFVASIELLCAKPQRNEHFGPWSMFEDLKHCLVQWFLVLILCATHIGVLFGVIVPGCPQGYMGPGGQHNMSAFENCTGGAAGYIDRMIFTDNHIYQNPTAKTVYHTVVPFDPEGVLGTLTSIALALIGAHCGHIIQCYSNSFSRLSRWLLFAVTNGLLSGLLCSWGKGGIIPVNKNLWSVSYIFASSSICFLLFSAMYWLIDHKRYWKGQPFIYAGMNAMTLYLGHEILKRQLPWRWPPFTTTHFEVLFMDVTAASLWLCVAYLLFRNNVFISL